MKKFITTALVFTCSLMLAGQAFALSFIAGDYKFVLDGVSRFEDPVPPGAAVPATGNLWGINQVQAIFYDASGIGLYDQNYWTKGDNSEYLTLRFGGLDLAVDPTGNPLANNYHISDAFGNDVSSLTLPHQSYFTSDVALDGALEVGPATGSNYAQLWLTNTDTYLNDVLAGANAAGAGAKGTFGTGMEAGSLVLDMEFAAGGVWLDELTNTGVTAAYMDEVYRAVITANTRNETLGYMDIIGGDAAWLQTFDTSGFFADSAFLGALSRTDGFDIRIEASNSSATPTPLSQALINAGWNARNESGSALAAAVPEPSTLILLGTGLLGFVGYSVRRNRNK